MVTTFIARGTDPTCHNEAPPTKDLKTEISQTPIPVAQSPTLQLMEQVRQWPGETILSDGDHPDSGSRRPAGHRILTWWTHLGSNQ